MRNIPKLAAVALGAILCWPLAACRKADGPPANAGEDPAKARLLRFWESYNEATRLRTAGNSAAAITKYRAALEDNPAHEDSLYYLAACLSELGEYRDAVQAYETLVRQNPASHRGHFQLGMTLATPQPGAVLDFRRARQAFERNIEINREESGPFLRLGELSLYEGKLEEARRFFDIAAGFQSPEGIFRAGFLRYTMGDYRAALPMFRKVLDINSHERKISGRGVHSEGDIQSAAGRFTPLERAGIQSLVFLYWTAQSLGGYPANVPDESRIAADSLPSPMRFEAMSQSPRARQPIPSVRDLWNENWQPLSDDQARRRFEALLGDRIPANSLAPGDLRSVVDAKAADFDRDGVAEAVVLTWEKGIRLYRRTTAGYQDVTGERGLPPDGGESFSLAVFDYDRDGWPDIFLFPYAPYVEVLQGIAHPVAARSPHAARVFRNVGGKFQETQVPGLAGAHGVVRAVPADFDTDGYPDLLLACGGLDCFRWEPSLVVRNNGGKSFSVAAWLPARDRPVRALGAEAWDWDGDGRTDICLRTSSGLRFFRNKNRGHVTPSP
jgi:tetratricopeptide (TPR) repeat protein